MDIVDMTVTMWASFIVASGINLEELENDTLSCVPIGPVIFTDPQPLPLLVFQNNEQMEFFNEHFEDIKKLIS